VTREGVARVFAMLTAAYPTWRVTEASVAVWADKLKDFDDADIDAAADAWVVSSSKAPAIADIIELARHEARRRHEEAAGSRGLPEPANTAQQQQIRKLMAVTRGMWQERDRRQHWHGGPEPCWCGGINPRVKRHLEDRP